MTGGHSRIHELRRRVRQDPASLAFAQLAEELRRAGANDEAVAVCRAGLAHHPTLLTARITLGRALVELNRLDEAFDTLTTVLHDSPGNPPAMRALAEVYQRRGHVDEALTYYRRAMQLEGEPAFDPARPAEDQPAGSTGAFEQKVEALFDFDALLAQLGDSGHSERAHVPYIHRSADALEQVVPGDGDERDALAMVEKQLRDRESRLMLDAQSRRPSEERSRGSAIRMLESWLSAIAEERRVTQNRA